MFTLHMYVCPAVYFIESESVSYSMCGMYCNGYYYSIIVQNHKVFESLSWVDLYLLIILAVWFKQLSWGYQQTSNAAIKQYADQLLLI